MPDENISSTSVAPVNKQKGQIPGIPKNWENFLLSISCVLLLPLAPIMYETLRGRHIGTAELMLTAAIYAISVGLSSKNRLTFIMTIFIFFYNTAAYGEFKNVPNPSASSEVIAYIAIALVALAHTLERYNLHVIDQKPWDFPGGGQ